MTGQEKLKRWEEKLLDTGKRNNLISFKDTKAHTVELLYPECETIFSKCSAEHVFQVFNAKIMDSDSDIFEEDEKQNNTKREPKITKEEYKNRYSRLIKSGEVLAWSSTQNAARVVKNIGKRAKEIQEESSINVAYLAFGFVKWKEQEKAIAFYKAPLLLIHVNIITGSITDPVRIEISDDDVVVNPTFNYLLEAEYGLKLPEYEEDDTLTSYLDKVEQVVRPLRWELVNECKLGLFSFLKINMYEDLKNNAEKILQNENVRKLLGISSSEYENVNYTGDGEENSVKNPLIELHTVVDADSSQIEAIEMAKKGKSFVLQGPPGTGKSQTITNIIAELLHDGKKILFVSEKQAALNVVFDKLKKAGLGDFCLELHSHKANKKAVVEELDRTLMLPKSSVSSSADEEIRQKQEAQLRLDTYADELHKKRETIDKSLYQLFELYSSLRNYPDVKFTIRAIQTRDLKYLLTASQLLEQYVEYIPSIGTDYRKSAWYGFKDSKLTYEDRIVFKEDLETLVEGYRQLHDTTVKIKAKYETPDLNFQNTKKWQALLAFSAGSDVITPSLLSREAFAYAYPYLMRMKEWSERIIPVRNDLFQTYKPGIVHEFDGKDLYSKLTGQFNSGISRMFSGEYKNLIARIQLYLNEPQKIKYKQALEMAQNLMNLQTSLQEYSQNESRIPGCLGRCYQGPDTDWNHVFYALETLRSYLNDPSYSFGAISKMSAQSFADHQTSFLADSNELSAEVDAIELAKARVSEKFFPVILDLERHSYNQCILKLSRCLEEFDKLGNWINFIDLLENLRKLELLTFVDLTIDLSIEVKDIPGVFKKLFYKQWIENTMYSVPTLASFTRINQDLAVKNFAKKDRIQYEISKAQIKSELSQNRPDFGLVAGGSQVSILRRESLKKRKKMPVRRLLSCIADLAQILKPCFLMSPLSVSTFLDPDKIGFDTVIFDEASQIFPQDALGAIYRAKQVIVVGDSKQMPPSNFFNASLDVDNDDEEELGDVSDFESILDVCSAVFTTKRLAWHYRSHYEQLIAFSNRNFYSNNLVTFPSSSKDHEGIGVDYYYVDGTFDRTKKTNWAEANFVVDLIYKNIKEYPMRSLGVVAFSVAQQTLIDRLLSKKREEDPSFEWFFSADNAEPFFIKNLESVQGDERDTIIFSVAYAKDYMGRFIQNFGPLNREGGERRLNVAVTRAKDNVQLVASIHYTDIDLSRVESEGAKLLRAYLDYAQNGELALERTINVSAEDKFDSYFEQEVCDFLRDQGFTVDTQVGCSGYRIDLGLREPDSSNYLLAIECDGATYHSSKNARDRDSLRQTVLEKMGWKFYRIWSTDWYKNTRIEKERLLEAARNAVLFHEKTPVFKPKKDAVAEQSIKESAEKRFVQEIKEPQFEFPKYVEVDALRIVKNYYDLRTGVHKILETEAPLSVEYLLKRIVSYFNREKVTNVVIDSFIYNMSGCERMGIIRRNGFLYLKGAPDPKLRVPGAHRDIKYISIEELADGLYTLIKQNITVERAGLFKSMNNLLGFSRLGDNIVSRYDEALKYLMKKDMIEDNNGVLSAKA